MKKTAKTLLPFDIPRLLSALVLLLGLGIWVSQGLPYHSLVLGILNLGMMLECIRFLPGKTLSSWIYGVLVGGAGWMGPYILDAMLPETTSWLPSLLPSSLIYGGVVLSVITAAFGFWTRARFLKTRPSPSPSLLLGMGTIFYGGWAIGSCSLMLHILPFSELYGLWLAPLWLTIIATDIGAYIGGRVLGGPKLAPWISAQKTWSGAVSGMVASIGCFWMCSQNLSFLFWPWYTAVGVSVLSQMGDALESMVKRYYGVKDSGHLIPGHGGLWDRLDGFLGVHAALGWGWMLVRLIKG